MTSWITPVFDRTQADVEYAKYLQDLNIDTLEDLKGHLNVSDLNRIENNCEYLNIVLGEHGYYIGYVPYAKGVWQLIDNLTSTELERIRKNVEKIKNIFASYTNCPVNYDMPNFEKTNDLEKILYEVNILIPKMVAVFRHCNTFYCGEE